MQELALLRTEEKDHQEEGETSPARVSWPRDLRFRVKLEKLYRAT